jgi:hypothetical protein
VSFTVSPPRSLAEGPPAAPGQGNEPDPQGGWTPALTAAPPGANDPTVAQADADVKAALQGVTDAKMAYDNAYRDYQAILQNPAADPLGDRLKVTKDVLDNTASNWQRAAAASEAAWGRVRAASEAAASRADNPYHNAYYAQHAAQAGAGADLARAQAASLTAKTDDERKQIQAQTALATAQAVTAGILSPAQAAQANAQASDLSSQAQQRNTLTPLLARQEAAKAAQAEAQAGIAPQAAQAALSKAQADADKARADVDETRRRIAGMPTEQQAQAAIDLGLKDKEADLQGKQLQVEQARQLMPLAVSQAGANVAATQAGTAATLAGIGQKTLGPLYGIGDQIGRYRDLIASGQLSPQDADTALNTYLNQQISGATPFQWAQEASRVAQERLNTAQSYATNTLNTFNQLAAGAGPGHGAELAAGYQAALGLGQQFFGQMGGFGPTGNPQATNQAPVVHINIGSGQPTSAPQQPAVTPQLPPAPPALPPAPPPLPALPPPPTPASLSAAAGVPIFGGPAAQPYAYQPETAEAAQARLGTGGGESGRQTPATETPAPEEQVQSGEIPALQRGGVVTRPTVALIGERGPEAVVPLQPRLPVLPVAAPGAAFFQGLPPLPTATPPGGVGGGAQNAWQAHLDRWADELKSGVVNAPGSQPKQEQR